MEARVGRAPKNSLGSHPMPIHSHRQYHCFLFKWMLVQITFITLVSDNKFIKGSTTQTILCIPLAKYLIFKLIILDHPLPQYTKSFRSQLIFILLLFLFFGLL